MCAMFGMVEGDEELRFAAEARETIGVVGDRRNPHLDRDVAMELCLARPIDLAHSACPERAKDFVRRYPRPSGQHGGRTPTASC
jgi:hypothetical protein